MTSWFLVKQAFYGAGHGELKLGSTRVSCLRASPGQVSRSLR